MGLPFYLVRTGRTLDVFGDPVEDARILDVPLGAWQRTLAARAGLHLETIERRDLGRIEAPCLVMDDDTFTTERFFRRFLVAVEERARTNPAVNLHAGLATNPPLARVVRTHAARAVPGGFVYPLRYLGAARDPHSEAVLLSMDDLAWSALRLPRALALGPSHPLCQSATAILTVRSPLHVYQANMHRLVEIVGELFAEGGASPHAPNRIAPSAWVHPTAHLEGCVVGERAAVGAHAVCTHSVIGARAQISEQAMLYRSVIGDGTSVAHQHRVFHAVTYPECFLISGALQWSIIGHASAIFAAWITDLRMDGGTIRTRIDGRLVDSGMSFLGVQLGHRARITAGVVTAPGRVVPNDALIHTPRSVLFTG